MKTKLYKRLRKRFYWHIYSTKNKDGSTFRCWKTYDNKTGKTDLCSFKLQHFLVQLMMENLGMLHYYFRHYNKRHKIKEAKWERKNREKYGDKFIKTSK